MRDQPKIIGVIPAHFDSQRLPGKVLLNIGEKAIVQWVYERARASSLLEELFVATDSERVEEYCPKFHLAPGCRHGGRHRIRTACQALLYQNFPRLIGFRPEDYADWKTGW